MGLTQPPDVVTFHGSASAQEAGRPHPPARGSHAAQEAITMAYDVHIVRTEHWLDAPNDPVTKEQVDALIASDPELAWSRRDWVDMSDDDGKVTRYYAILWHGGPTFWWYGTEIICSGPSEDQLAKMISMAIELDANVIGDDGEEYH